MTNSIGRIIRHRREQLGLTMEQLAEKAGVSYSLISRLELNNVENARITKLSDIAEALDLDLVDLFTDEKLSGAYTIQLINYLAGLDDEKRERIAKSMLDLLQQ